MRTTSSEVEETRVALLRVMGIGGALIAVLGPFDLYMRATRFPDASVVWCVGWRLAAVLSVLGCWLLVRSRRRWTQLGLFAAGTFAMCSSLTCFGMLAVQLGGLESSLLFTPAYYAVSMGAFVPTRGRTTLLMAGPAMCLFLGTIVVGVALTPSLAPQLEDSRVVSAFFQSSLRILGIMAFAGVSGHILWRTRRRLREAYRLGRYLLKQLLGQGGMNEVWLAWDSHLKREVALKLLHSRHPNDARIARFEREARATSRLHSPHTVRIFDFGQSGTETFWIAMEYLRGMDLDRMVAAHGPLEPRRALHFARQAASALAEAHDVGLVHRDVKPANLMALSVTDQADFVKVLDFGIARQLDTREASLTLVGMVVGTPAFMAPEVLAGAPAEPASDVWSLGATLYCLLTGTLPFEYAPDAGPGGSRGRLVPPSERLGKPLVVALDALVIRCMDADPARRPANAGELALALDELAVDPWTPDEARSWWANHAVTRDVVANDEASALAPTEVDAAGPASR